MSAAVCAIRPIRPKPCLTRSRTHSAPVRVLPQPRPARMSQANHSDAGGSCSSRAQKRQSYSSAAFSAVVRLASSVWRRLGGSDRSELAVKRSGGIAEDIDRCLGAVDKEAMVPSE